MAPGTTSTVQILAQTAAPSDVSPQALALIDAGLRRGTEVRCIVRAARLLQGYELLFWDTAYTLSTETS